MTIGYTPPEDSLAADSSTIASLPPLVGEGAGTLLVVGEEAGWPDVGAAAVGAGPSGLLLLSSASVGEGAGAEAEVGTGTGKGVGAGV
eukprot:CAMPEP_0197851942 /NCGR_PEP_ID=MMETSP1438-20131217/19271_1 /TAXON_ID=1461541 /ORGANISM="Pterosperma sp., Strain CCMP1384" /LENGTH=87 /DNA_ID=CAMNT_0043465749 /DNA_START=628 /DNA_END=888 /DNA_ORIENTATION=+